MRRRRRRRLWRLDAMKARQEQGRVQKCKEPQLKPVCKLGLMPQCAGGLPSGYLRCAWMAAVPWTGAALNARATIAARKQVSRELVNVKVKFKDWKKAPLPCPITPRA